MRALMLIPTAAAVLAGCATPATPSGNAFASEVAGRVPGRPMSCVTTFPDQNLRVLDPATLAYGYGRTVYVNHLAAPCPALSQFNTLIVEAQGGQYCRGDRIRGREPGAIIPGPICNLGDWIPYSMR